MPLAKLILVEPFKPAIHHWIHKTVFVIGRAADCDLVLDRSGISKHHTQIVFDHNQFLVRDLESKNKTLVNGDPIKERKLSDRDLITLGGIDLQFRTVQERDLDVAAQKSLNKIQSAARFTRSISRNLTLDPILDEVMNALIQLSQAERGFLLVEDQEGKLQMARSVNIGSDELRSKEFRLSMSAIERAIETKEAVAISNAMDDTYFGDQSSVQDLELKTLVCVPMITPDNRVIGVLYADSTRDKQEFAELDVQLLESLAANASIGIVNANLNREIADLIGSVSDVLKNLERSSGLDGSLKSSVQRSLGSLATLKQKRLRRPLAEIG